MHSHPQAAASNSYERCFQVINQSEHERVTRRVIRLVSLPNVYRSPLTSLSLARRKTSLSKLPINRKEPVINDFRTNLKIISSTKKKGK